MLAPNWEAASQVMEEIQSEKISNGRKTRGACTSAVRVAIRNGA